MGIQLYKYIPTYSKLFGSTNNNLLQMKAIMFAADPSPGTSLQ